MVRRTDQSGYKDRLRWLGGQAGVVRGTGQVVRETGQVVRGTNRSG